MAPFLLAWLVCGALSFADRGIGAPARLMRHATGRPAALIVGLTAVLAATNLLAGGLGTLLVKAVSADARLLLLAFALACAAVACVLGRERERPVGPWVGLAELALARPIAAGGFVVFAACGWSGDLLPVAGATVGELAVLGLAHWGGVAPPDGRPWRWGLAVALAVVAAGLALVALR